MAELVVRQAYFNFPIQLERHWLGQSPFKTHFFNGLTLLFPEAEQLAIRYFQKVLPQIQDANLKAEMIAFIGQEGQHSAAHSKFWHTLRQQGYSLDRFERILQIFISKKQRFNTAFYLATIAGFEHFTDCLSEFVLESGCLSDAPPQLRELFEWHFAEELEHKTVAYDVFVAVSNQYWLRILGLINAHSAIAGALSLGLVTLLVQDGQLFKRKTWQDLVQFSFLKERFCLRALANFWDYWRRDFHPSQRDNSLLYQQIFAQCNCLQPQTNRAG
jgi:uncharacterized protein